MNNVEAIKNIKPKRGNLISDAMAGLTFALVNVPQSMAHALLAAVNPVFGLYTLMLAAPVGAIFTSSVFMNVSTTSAMAVATGDTMLLHPSASRPSILVTLVILIGIFQLLLGLFRLGWITRFIPFSVMTGFMTGVAVLIIIGQLGDFTGYYSTYSRKVMQVADLVLHTGSIVWVSFAIGMLTIALVYLLGLTRFAKYSMILALVIASAAAVLINQFSADAENIKLVRDVADVQRSLPSLALPDPKLFAQLIIPAMTIGIIGLVQGAGVSQTFPNPDGKFSDVSRDFFGQGAANIATGFFSGIPAGGSSSGTALVTSAGARSRWANIFAGLFVALIVLLFANVVELVAMPALAGLVIVAGVQMINVNNIQTVWQTNPVSRAIMVITFASTLMIPLQFAVLLGIALSIILFVFQQSNILHLVEWDVQESGWPVEKPVSKQLESDRVTILYPYGNLFYAAADALEKKLPDPQGTQRPVVILVLRGMDDLGSTVIGTLHRYAASLYACNGKLMLVGVSPSLHSQLQRTGMVAFLGEENIFAATRMIGESGNNALRAAREWLGQNIPEDSKNEIIDRPLESSGK